MRTSRSTSPRGASPDTTGLTLLELVVVMAILATLFGLGVGAFRGTVAVERLAAQQVSDALRAARLMAASGGAPAAVLVDPAAGTVRAVGLRRVGNWHFEREDGAGWPVPAAHGAGTLVADGHLGRALQLAGGATLSIGAPPPSFDGTTGFLLELWLRPEAEGRPMTILQRHGSFHVFLDAHDELRVNVVLAGEEGGVPLDSGPSGLRLSPERLQRLAVSWDGRTLAVALDGLPVLERVLDERGLPLAVARGVSLHTGEHPNQYRGVLDELSFAVFVAEPARPLPDGVTLAGGPRRVQLDAFGRLDGKQHGERADVPLLFGEPPRALVVRMERLGPVRTLDPGPPDPAWLPAVHDDGARPAVPRGNEFR